jgi:hypothetical protein
MQIPQGRVAVLFSLNLGGARGPQRLDREIGRYGKKLSFSRSLIWVKSFRDKSSKNYAENPHLSVMLTHLK